METPKDWTRSFYNGIPLSQSASFLLSEFFDRNDVT